MKRTVKDLIDEFNSIDKLKLFEIEVLDTKFKETDYILFDLSIQKHTLRAEHTPLTTKEQRSKKIAFKKVVLDPTFSLDEILQDLYYNCLEAIIESDFYELND